MYLNLFRKEWKSSSTFQNYLYSKLEHGEVNEIGEGSVLV